MSIPAPFKIGDIVIDPPLVLAPMAGVSHSPFRRLVASFGKPGLFFSEMLSARHLPNDIKKNSLWLQRYEVERPLAYQIVAPNPEEALTGARELAAYGAEIVDLNLACPAPNIARRRSGARLLSEPSLVEAILKVLRRALACPMTVKIRLGEKADLARLRDLAGMLEDCGVDAITLHPRLTSEKLKGRARWDYIGELKGVTRLPVIGNGDVTCLGECLAMFRQTGCDGVMIGRAAVQRPWIFGEIMGRDYRVDSQFLQEVYREAWLLIAGFYPEPQALGRIKEFTWHFSRNLLFGHRLAARMQNLSSLAACREFLDREFIRSCGDG